MSPPKFSRHRQSSADESNSPAPVSHRRNWASERSSPAAFIGSPSPVSHRRNWNLERSSPVRRNSPPPVGHRRNWSLELSTSPVNKRNSPPPVNHRWNRALVRITSPVNERNSPPPVGHRRNWSLELSTSPVNEKNSPSPVRNRWNRALERSSPVRRNSPPPVGNRRNWALEEIISPICDDAPLEEGDKNPSVHGGTGPFPSMMFQGTENPRDGRLRVPTRQAGHVYSRSRSPSMSNISIGYARERSPLPGRDPLPTSGSAITKVEQRHEISVQSQQNSKQKDFPQLDMIQQNGYVADRASSVVDDNAMDTSALPDPPISRRNKSPLYTSKYHSSSTDKVGLETSSGGNVGMSGVTVESSASDLSRAQLEFWTHLMESRKLKLTSTYDDADLPNGERQMAKICAEIIGLWQDAAGAANPASHKMSLSSDGGSPCSLQSVLSLAPRWFHAKYMPIDLGLLKRVTNPAVMADYEKDPSWLDLDIMNSVMQLSRPWSAGADFKDVMTMCNAENNAQAMECGYKCAAGMYFDAEESVILDRFYLPPGVERRGTFYNPSSRHWMFVLIWRSQCDDTSVSDEEADIKCQIQFDVYDSSAHPNGRIEDDDPDLDDFEYTGLTFARMNQEANPDLRWSLPTWVDSPKQDDSSDCGIFALKNAIECLTDASPFVGDTNSLRLRYLQQVRDAVSRRLSNKNLMPFVAWQQLDIAGPYVFASPQHQVSEVDTDILLTLESWKGLNTDDDIKQDYDLIIPIIRDSSDYATTIRELYNRQTTMARDLADAWMSSFEKDPHVTRTVLEHTGFRNGQLIALPPPPNVHLPARCSLPLGVRTSVGPVFANNFRGPGGIMHPITHEEGYVLEILAYLNARPLNPDDRYKGRRVLLIQIGWDGSSTNLGWFADLENRFPTLSLNMTIALKANHSTTDDAWLATDRGCGISWAHFSVHALARLAPFVLDETQFLLDSACDSYPEVHKHIRLLGILHRLNTWQTS